MFIEEVADGTYRLETQIPELHTIFTVYFIKESSGAAVIEPGPATIIPAIQTAVRELGISNIEYIIPTHLHLDHAGGIGKLARLYPQAKVAVNPQAAKHVIDPSRLIRSTRMAFGENFEATHGSILPVPESQVRIIQDKERLTINGRQLMIVHTRGHAPHHIAIFDTKTRGLFCGEALGMIYTPNTPPLPAMAPPNFDAEVYLNDMELLKRLQPQLLFFSHDGVGNKPEQLITTVIENTKIIGDAILQMARTEKTEEAVIRKIGDFIWERFGVRMEEYDLLTNVSGYMHYLKKKGLVQSESTSQP